MDTRAKIINGSRFSLPCIALLCIALGLHLISLCNYLLFHTLSEFFSVIIACAIFIFAWNTRHIQSNHFFLFLGMAYLFIGLLDLLHCLTCAGMGIFPPALAASGASEQLWLAARSMESCSLLLAFCFIRRKCSVGWTMAACLLISCLLLLLIFICPVFPACETESGRLTEFKRQGEYFVALLLACSLPLLHWHRASFDREVLRLMQAAVLLAIAAELAQTFHASRLSLASFASHLFRIFSCYAIYRAVIATGLTQPYNTLFRELNAHKDELEEKVRQRTAALQQSRDSLQAEMAGRLRTEKELLWELAVNRTLAQAADALISRSLPVREVEKLVGRAARELIGCEYGMAKAAQETGAEEEGSLGQLTEMPWDSVLNTRQSFYTNTLSAPAQAVRMQPEHLPYRNYLHVPAVIEGRAVGRIALANKEGDFAEADLAAAERLAAVFALAVQRRQTEDSLSRSERKYRSLFNDAPDMIHILSQEKKIVDANPAELLALGCLKEELVGTPLLDIVHPEFRRKTAQALEQIFTFGRSMQQHETALITRSGGQVDVEVSAVPLLENGRVVSVRAIMRDITGRKKEEQERKKLEAQLRQSRKMEAIGTLAGGIAHDFNNILGPILGYAEMALDALPEGSSIAPWLNEVLRAGGRAKELVRQILAISRKCEQELQPLRIQPVIKETLKLLRSSLPATIEIRQRLDPACGTVLADPTRIHQVVMNLCTNAYHAMREIGGLLEVFLRQTELDEAAMPGRLRLPPGSYLQLEVRDSGPGIPEELLEKIFEPYFTTRDKGEGTGLGLALVQSIALDFGGDVAVVSEPGCGAAFSVYLPVIKAAQEKGPCAAAAPLPGGCERLLVVDDDVNIAELAMNMLVSLGYQVTARTSSPDALALFAAEPESFDLVLTDMTMPQMTGAELAARLLALRPGLPVLLCTGFSELMDEQKAAALGLRALLMKPFSKAELACAVRAALTKEISAAVCAA
uniref:MASE3 domain-containing protein n=1 Tax=Candidatus Electronema sp. TaxID=2698783 RepID=UPI004056A043